MLSLILHYVLNLNHFIQCKNLCVPSELLQIK